MQSGSKYERYWEKVIKVLTTSVDIIWGAVSQNILEQDSGSSQVDTSLAMVTPDDSSCDKHTIFFVRVHLPFIYGTMKKILRLREKNIQLVNDPRQHIEDCRSTAWDTNHYGVARLRPMSDLRLWKTQSFTVCLSVCATITEVTDKLRYWAPLSLDDTSISQKSANLHFFNCIDFQKENSGTSEGHINLPVVCGIDFWLPCMICNILICLW